MPGIDRTFIRSWRRWIGALALLGLLIPARALQEAPPPQPGQGHVVEWEGWSFRWAVRPREGLVLGDVEFRGRRVLKHAALAEIFVPYDQGEPRPEDSLEGMGTTLIELKPGEDCVPNTVCRMFDAAGRPGGKPVVAMHEESAGPVYIGRFGRAVGKRLVVWGASRLGGYTYLTRWVFTDDGRLFPEAGLTGELEHTRQDDSSRFGATVGRNDAGRTIFAPAHVHNFYYRLDFDVDGPADDVVEEMDHRQDTPGRSLTAGDSWTPVLGEGPRNLSAGTFRSWRVADRKRRNALGHPVSWEIVPGGNGVFRGAEQERFAQADLWVMRYRPSEFPFSGPRQGPVSQVLAGYANGENVEGQDVVVWYVMHVHHRPRTEDWPAMPIEWAGFGIIPRDVFDASPLRPK